MSIQSEKIHARRGGQLAERAREDTQTAHGTWNQQLHQAGQNSDGHNLSLNPHYRLNPSRKKQQLLTLPWNIEHVAVVASRQHFGEAKDEVLPQRINLKPRGRSLLAPKDTANQKRLWGLAGPKDR